MSDTTTGPRHCVCQVCVDAANVAQAEETRNCQVAAVLGRSCRHCDELIAAHRAECVRLTGAFAVAMLQRDIERLYPEWIVYWENNGPSACVLTFASLQALRDGALASRRLQKREMLQKRITHYTVTADYTKSHAVDYKRNIVMICVVQLVASTSITISSTLGLRFLTPDDAAKAAATVQTLRQRRAAFPPQNVHDNGGCDGAAAAAFDYHMSASSISSAFATQEGVRRCTCRYCVGNSPDDVEVAQRDRCRQAALLGRVCEHCDALMRQYDEECMDIVEQRLDSIFRAHATTMYDEWIRYCGKYGVSVCVITYDSMEALRESRSSGYRMQSAKIARRNFPTIQQLQTVLARTPYPFETFIIIAVAVKVAEYATIVAVTEVPVEFKLSSGGGKQ